jgi:hypothetical protein
MHSREASLEKRPSEVRFQAAQLPTKIHISVFAISDLIASKSQWFSLDFYGSFITLAGNSGCLFPWLPHSFGVWET